MTVAIAGVAAGLLGLAQRDLGIEQRDLGENLDVLDGQVEILTERPYIEGLETLFEEAERLIIVGRAFGESPGSVELFYELPISDSFEDEMNERASQNRSTTITLRGDRIEDWTETQILVNTTPGQRRVLLASIGAEDFTNLIPYLRVVTADRRRSNLW